MIHDVPSSLAGQTVKVLIGGSVFDFVVEDWWDRVVGRSWMVSDGNPAALKYAVRSAKAGLPTDDDVLYGKVGMLGDLVHISEVVKESGS